MDYNIFYLFALFFVAFMYASVGHGGASGYLALMALFGVSTITMRASALTLNLFVAGVSFYAYYRGGFFRKKLLIPFVIGSIPMAFIGARIIIEAQLFKYILGVFLIIAVARMVYSPKGGKEIIPFNFVLALLLGTILGFFSGLIGIGGGIILSPVLLLLGWANVKETAAISAIFIFLNSTAGIFGLLSTNINLNPQLLIWVIIALGGGLIGAYSGSVKFSLSGLRYLLAFVLLLASIKLLLV
jgi:uncharacterized protein